MKKETWATSAIIAYNFHPPRGVYLEERLRSRTCLTVTSLRILIHCTWARYYHLFVYTTYKNIYIHFENKNIYILTLQSFLGHLHLDLFWNRWRFLPPELLPPPHALPQKNNDIQNRTAKNIRAVSCNLDNFSCQSGQEKNNINHAKSYHVHAHTM
jgi:hypothetical protein